MRLNLCIAFMSSGLWLSGCVTKGPPFDAKPTSFASATDIAKRKAAADVGCNSDHADPIVRIPPIMPANALRTGRVSFLFDLDDAGAPMNIRITDASEEIFIRPTLRSLEKWKYARKFQGENGSKRRNICSYLTFLLTDEQCRKLPTWIDIEAQNLVYKKYVKSLTILPNS